MSKRLVMVLATALAAWASRPAEATALLAMARDTLIDQAELIFTGTVRREEVALTGDGSFPFTFLSFEVDEVLKGAVSEPELTLCLPGGPIGHEQVMVEGAPRFAPGERYLLFVSGNGTAGFPIVGWTQGHLRFVTTAQGEALVDDDGNEIQGLGERGWTKGASGSPAPEAVVLEADGVTITPAAPRRTVGARSGAVLEQLRAAIRARAASPTSLPGRMVRSARVSDLPFTLADTPAPVRGRRPHAATEARP